MSKNVFVTESWKTEPTNSFHEGKIENQGKHHADTEAQERFAIRLKAINISKIPGVG